MLRLRLLGVRVGVETNRQSNMTHQFAIRMERKAHDIADRLTPAQRNAIHGIKCWYSAAGLFVEGAKRVFVGINPGGGEEADSTPDEIEIHRQASYKDPRFNAWLDESWGNPPGEHKHQRAAKRVFRILYKENWQEVFRTTPCFNVSPFRTPNINQLPEEAWRESESWFKQVMEHLKPKCVICDGNGKYRSLWSALCNIYSVDETIPKRIQRNIYLKQGVIQSAPLTDTRIIALPHLSRFGGENLYRQLQELSQTHDWP